MISWREARASGKHKKGVKRISGIYKSGHTSNRFSVLKKAKFVEKAQAQLKRHGFDPSSLVFLPDGRYTVEIRNNGRDFKFLEFLVRFY